MGELLVITDTLGFQAVPQINSYYVYGVSITHGTSRNHMLVYQKEAPPPSVNCPCSKPGHPDNAS